jgi:hypothetical protein
MGQHVLYGAKRRKESISAEIQRKRLDYIVIIYNVETAFWIRK